MRGLYSHVKDKIHNFFASKDQSETLLQARKAEFSIELLKYEHNRKKYAELDGVPLDIHFYLPLPFSDGRKKVLNGSIKVSSASILRKESDGDPNITYTDINISALTTSGDLNDIVEKMRQYNLLPPIYLRREQEYLEKCNHIKEIAGHRPE